MEKEIKKKKTKGKLHRTAKAHVEAEVYINNKKCDWIYTYTYTPISKINSPTKIKYNKLTKQTKETKNYIY